MTAVQRRRLQERVDVACTALACSSLRPVAKQTLAAFFAACFSSFASFFSWFLDMAAGGDGDGASSTPIPSAAALLASAATVSVAPVADSVAFMATKERCFTASDRAWGRPVLKIRRSNNVEMADDGDKPTAAPQGCWAEFRVDPTCLLCADTAVLPSTMVLEYEYYDRLLKYRYLTITYKTRPPQKPYGKISVLKKFI